MRVITGRNVHQILPAAVRLLLTEGIKRDSRNGPVLQLPEPVTTVYTHPNERVLLWPRRDANPFLHLYECLWMLAGRRDVASMTRYAKRFAEFSDDGVHFHGAYGHRWRKHFEFDQLLQIVQSLMHNPNDRRCVLQMWDATQDLSKDGKDLPCNLIATFQVNTNSRLDLTVFCRSNDIVWGAYGANAVHFSFLLEYVAAACNLPVGVYRQVSVNWHGYLKTLEPLALLENDAFTLDGDYKDPNPYEGKILHVPMPQGWSLRRMDNALESVIHDVNTGFSGVISPDASNDNFWWMVHGVLQAHHVYKLEGKGKALESLHYRFSLPEQKWDWFVAAREWLERRTK